MLYITVPETEYFNELTNEFTSTKETKLQLEHSLVSLSKWEAKWHKPFLGKDKRTREETIDYIKFMTLTQNVNPDVYDSLSKENMAEINEYIQNPMTATWFKEDKNRPKSREVMTAEIIYYQMIALQIPFECQKWHLNRLLTLIKVCSIKNSPGKKMSKNEILKNNASLNAARRAQMGTKG